MALSDSILALTRQLYPSGRAFKFPFGGTLEKLHAGLALSEERAYLDAVGLLDSALPDNDNFLAADATAWEKRLGLITNEATALADRKLAISRKMAHPGTIKARQHYLYLQGQLQAAGFNVYVFENIFPAYIGGLETRTPSVVSGVGNESVQHGELQHGDIQHGGNEWKDYIVNNVDQILDLGFIVSPNLKSTFFIGGNPVGTFANVPIAREKEFRQLVLKIKPVQTLAYLFINFV